MIWVASSRVGASTRPDGRDGRRLLPESLLTNGIAKASVFPLPVLPRPSTSRPARVSGRVSHLDRERVGDAARGERADQWCTHAEIGESLVCSHFSVPFRHRVCRVRRDGSRADQHKVARLPVGKIDRRETVVLGHDHRNSVFQPRISGLMPVG